MSLFSDDELPLEREVLFGTDYRVDIVKPHKRFAIQVATDEFFVKEAIKAYSFFLTFFICAAISGVTFFLVSLIVYVNWWFYLLPCFFLALALFHLLLPKRMIKLDRLNGKITYPRQWWKSDQFTTIPFNDLQVYSVTKIKDLEEGSMTDVLQIRDNEYKYKLLLETSQAYDYWVFMVWYMDCNRPLPPGTAFDAYRQRDFERRKAKGFPKPLYRFMIDTPEATPEQQAERKKIGKW